MNRLKYIYLGLGLIFLLGGCSDDKTPEIKVEPLPLDLVVNSDSPNVSTADHGLTYKVDFSAVGGEATFTVESSDRNWTLLEGTDAEWLKTETSYGSFTLTVGINPNNTSNQTTIKVGAGEGAEAKTVAIHITQRTRGDAALEVDKEDVRLTAGGKYPQTVTITTNNELFQIKTSSEWLFVEQEGKTLTLTPDVNSTLKDRTTQVIVLAEGDDGSIIERVINVTQDAKAFITFSQTAFSFYATDTGSGVTTITTNQSEWRVDLEQYDWATLTREGDDLSFSFDPNSDRESRVASIAITVGELDNVVTEYFILTQVGDNPKEMVFELTIPDRSVPAYVPIYGVMDCTVNWGDGTIEKIGDGENPTHQYLNPGKYYPIITGSVPTLSSGTASVPNKAYLTAVKRWGKTGLLSLNSAFYNCKNLQEIAGDSHASFAEVTSFLQAFGYANALKAIPYDLFKYATKATNFTSTFYSNTSITEIPGILFSNCVNAEIMEFTFYGMKGISTIPKTLFYNCPKITSFSLCFSDAGVEVIPAGLFDKNLEVVDFIATFGNTKIKRIPDDLFRYNTKVLSMPSLFRDCTALEEIPADLFKYNTEVDNFFSVFNACSSLKEIPAGLFDNNKKNTEFRVAFFDCTALTIVPAGLFDNNTMVTNYFGVFQRCTSLEEVPDKLFAKATAATNFDRLFYNASALKAVPPNLFNCPNVTTAANMFYNCSSLEEIPVGLFDSFVKVTTFSSTFYGCKALKIVPANIFANCPNVTFGTSMFYNCSSLEEIPVGLFDSFVNVTSFATAFYGCKALKTVPISLFDNCKKVTNFSQTFRNCSAWAGPTPYTNVDGVNIKLWDRAPANGFSKVTSSANCFNGCTILVDNDIPATGWK